MKIKRSVDPSQTTLLRRQFIVSMNRRFDDVKLAVRELFAEDMEEFKIADNATKVALFRKWLTDQINTKILIMTNGLNRKLWTSVYVTNAYYKGILRAYNDVNMAGNVLDNINWFGGAENQFLKDVMRLTPIISQIEFLEIRVSNLLQGVTDDMLNKMSWIFANSISKDENKSKTVYALEKVINKVSKKRAKLIAIAEIVHAQAEGQLDGFELLGVDEVDTVVELLTTKRHTVCPICRKLEKGTFEVKKARGIIPFHPLCKCAWSMSTSKFQLKRKVKFT